ncbi:MAG: LysR family transcriptional regulator [Gluconacetobacter diazotrophicus]|nr:LysR family transcriptional regulator [Gluconacetobacter diazotrophicus]
MMESRQLRYFLATAETLHFGGAADRLHIAQSALSAQIRRLEQQLGVRLFNRNKREAVSLTPAGQLFLPEAAAAVRQMERAEQVGRAAARGAAGRVSIGYVGSALFSGLLPGLLRRFRAEHPLVRVELSAMETPRQPAALAEGRIDVAVLRPCRHYGEGTRAFVAHREGMVVAVPNDHPLADAAPLRAADLAGEVFIEPLFAEVAGFADSLARLCALGGFTAEPAYRVDDFVAALGLASAGYGIVLGPDSLRRLAPATLRFRPVEGFDEQVELVVAHRERTDSPSVRAFVRMARSLACRPGP